VDGLCLRKAQTLAALLFRWGPSPYTPTVRLVLTQRGGLAFGGRVVRAR
jgi:hypothetical protein